MNSGPLTIDVQGAGLVSPQSAGIMIPPNLEPGMAKHKSCAIGKHDVASLGCD